jgi:glycerate kinase
MKIVIAPDSFKESAPAHRVAAALAAGIRRAMPGADLVLAPMADGGEGTVDALVAGTSGVKTTATVTGPLGEPVTAEYGILGAGVSAAGVSAAGVTAVIEMAAASGLELVSPDRRDPRVTTTRGVGELILDALGRGLRRFVMGIGGSATNDGGAGMAQALGYRLLDAGGRELPPGGAALARLDRIDSSGRHPALADTVFSVACDVTNLLCGPLGASRVFGPQKGAGEAAVEELDAALMRFGEVVARDLGVRVLDVAGAGAAGGLGAGLLAFCGARLMPGAEVVAQACRLEERMAGADLVVTGEGRIDRQTAGGKTPLGVARIAKKLGIPVVAVAGALGEGYEVLYELGIDAVFPIQPRPMTLAESIACCEDSLERAGENIARLITALK